MTKLMKKVCNWKVVKVKGKLKVLVSRRRAEVLQKFLVWCKEWSMDVVALADKDFEGGSKEAMPKYDKFFCKL